MFNLQVSPHNSLRISEKLKAGTRQMAIKTIASYQRYLSPLKGYHCAHRQLRASIILIPISIPLHHPPIPSRPVAFVGLRISVVVALLVLVVWAVAIP